jgi:hypothetical protein
MQHLTSSRYRKEQCAGAHHGQWMQPQLKGGDHAKPAATSAEGPEQIRFVIMIDDSWCAICTDNLEPHYVIYREPS